MALWEGLALDFLARQRPENRSTSLKTRFGAKCPGANGFTFLKGGEGRDGGWVGNPHCFHLLGFTYLCWDLVSREDNVLVQYPLQACCSRC